MNRAELIGGDANLALTMIFGEGVIKFSAEAEGVLHGGLAMGEGFSLHLSGQWRASQATLSFACVGLGISGSATEGWEYGYRGSFAPRFDEAVDEVDCLVGTVLRAKAHGADAPAGVTASFIAVRRPVGLLRPARARRPSFAPKSDLGT